MQPKFAHMIHCETIFCGVEVDNRVKKFRLRNCFQSLKGFLKICFLTSFVVVVVAAVVLVIVVDVVVYIALLLFVIFVTLFSLLMMMLSLLSLLSLLFLIYFDSSSKPLTRMQFTSWLCNSLRVENEIVPFNFFSLTIRSTNDIFRTFRDLDLTVVKEARGFFGGHFCPLLKRVIFF